MPGARTKALKQKQKKKQLREKKKKQQQKKTQQQQQQQQQQQTGQQQQHQSEDGAEIVLSQAEAAYAEMRFEDCIALCDQIAETVGAHPGALEIKALCLLQMEQAEEAYALLHQCVQLMPDEGASKYLYLGQMASGEEATQALSKGIEILAAELDQMSGEATDEEMQEQRDAIAAAFCSLAEVYLTDLW